MQRCVCCKCINLPLGDLPYLECGGCGVVPHVGCELKRAAKDRYECIHCHRRDYTRGGIGRATLRFHLHAKRIPCEDCGLSYVSPEPLTMQSRVSKSKMSSSFFFFFCFCKCPPEVSEAKDQMSKAAGLFCHLLFFFFLLST